MNPADILQLVRAQPCLVLLCLLGPAPARAQLAESFDVGAAAWSVIVPRFLPWVGLAFIVAALASSILRARGFAGKRGSA